MSFRLVDRGWNQELVNALKVDHTHVRIMCPFIKKQTLERLLATVHPKEIQVITRFNLSDFAERVSDLTALRFLLERGARVRGVRNLHSKLYLFGENRAVVTSANLTDAALLRNHELGFIAEDADIVKRCCTYFDNMWAQAGKDLTTHRLNGWEEKVSDYLASGAGPHKPTELGDEGSDVRIAADKLVLTPWLTAAPQAYVKFLGTSNNRVELSFLTIKEIERAGCHWAVAYPENKRPTGVKEGSVIFIARLTKDPKDIRVFGRAIGMRYKPGRDDATFADIKLRTWKKIWPRYVRVHHAEFVSGSMVNGISLNDLMDTFKARSFKATKQNFAKGTGNINPRKAYMQQAAVELSDEGFVWLNEQLETSFERHGKLGSAELAKLDWPKVPLSS